MVGYSPDGEMRLPVNTILNKEVTLKSVFRYRHNYPMAIQAVASGKVRVKELVSNEFTLVEAQKDMEYSIAHKEDIMKTVIKI